MLSSCLNDVQVYMGGNFGNQNPTKTNTLLLETKMVYKLAYLAFDSDPTMSAPSVSMSSEDVLSFQD